MASQYKHEPYTPKKSFFPFTKWLYLLLLLSVLGIYFFNSGNSNIQETSWQQFKQDMLIPGDVKKVNIINKEKVQVYIKDDSLVKDKYMPVSKNAFGVVNKGPHYYFPIGSIETFERHLDEAQALFQEKEKIIVLYTNTENSWWSKLLSWLLPILLIAVFWFFISKRLRDATGTLGNSLFDFGKSNPKLYEKGKYSPITFKDVAGYDEAKAEVMEIVEFLKQPGNFTKLGAKIPKGILFIGPPGTGKTLIAKAIAGEAGVPFFSLTGSEFVEMFVGVGASRVRDLFTKAKTKAPSIVFIDEIDTVGRMRGRAMSAQANDERENTLNQLLAEMDGFDHNTGVIVLAATNRADILDPALMRPGRFDRHIYLDLPNRAERLAIFGVHLKPLLLATSVDAAQLAAQTPGFSGADIANVCNEAALIAARKRKSAVESPDFMDAIDRIISGLEKKSKVISPAEKKIIAFHEAGHAVVSWMLKYADPLLKVSIIPRGKSLGGAWYLPEERQIVTKAQFFDRICVALGGRVAEELVFNEISSGALDDLEKVTKQAYTMVAQLGLSEEIGNISFYDSSGMYESSFHKPYSEATAQLIDEEVRKLVKLAHTTAFNILENNREKLTSLATLLQQKEVVYKPEIESILGKKSH